MANTLNMSDLQTNTYQNSLNCKQTHKNQDVTIIQSKSSVVIIIVQQNN